MLLAAVLFVKALVSIHSVIRTPHDPHGREPSTLRIARGVLRGVVQIAIGTTIGSLAFPEGSRSISLAALAVVVIASFVLMLANALRERVDSAEPLHGGIRGLLREELRQKMLGPTQFFKNASRIIAPEPSSWKEVWAPRGLSKNVLSFGTFLFGYVGLILMSVLLAILGLLVSLGSMPGPEGVLIKAAAGFNALFVVSIFTIASLCVVSAMALLRHLGVVRFEIKVSDAMKSLATWVGYGTLSGVIGAALSPVIFAAFHQTTSQYSGALLPSVLIDLPACGAVLGYLLGLLVIVLSLGRGASNLLYRHLLVPTLFALSLVALYHLGLTPELLFHQLITNKVDLAQIPYDVCSVAETDIRVRDRLLDPTWLLAVMEECGTVTVISGKALVQFALWGVGIVAILKFIGGLRLGVRNLESSELRREERGAYGQVRVGS